MEGKVQAWLQGYGAESSGAQGPGLVISVLKRAEQELVHYAEGTDVVRSEDLTSDVPINSVNPVT